MEPNLLKDGVLIEKSAGIGTITRKMLRERAVELAIMGAVPRRGVSAETVHALSASSQSERSAGRIQYSPALW